MNAPSSALAVLSFFPLARALIALTTWLGGVGLGAGGWVVKGVEGQGVGAVVRGGVGVVTSTRGGITPQNLGGVTYLEPGDDLAKDGVESIQVAAGWRGEVGVVMQRSTNDVKQGAITAHPLQITHCIPVLLKLLTHPTLQPPHPPLPQPLTAQGPA